jgi:hypothetical protein
MTFARLLTIVTAGLGLIAMIVGVVLLRLAAMPKWRRIKVANRPKVASEWASLGEHVESPGLAEHTGCKLSNSDPPARPNVVRHKMVPRTPLGSEHSWADIEESIRALLQELEQRQDRLRGSDFNRMRASDLDAMIEQRGGGFNER